MNCIIKKKHIAGLCLAAAFFLGACKTAPVAEVLPRTEPGPPPQESAGPGLAESRPRVLIRDELTVAFSKSEVELDFRKSYLASEAQLFTAVYEGLFSYHPFTMEPVPAAADHWELSEDKKQWTFSIRQNAKYWNGDSLTAEDFRAAWLSLLAPGGD
ncbi:MAG: ABC transporter substrate-binding protein, partial [Treponema sp.]|nr:ABC transporter substrate-binding protein [Treponema sp.]